MSGHWRTNILGAPSSTTTPNMIHLSAQPHHSLLILLGLAGNDLFQQGNIFAGPWLERETKAPIFEETQTQSIGQCMLALWNFNIICPHPDITLLSANRFQAGELGDTHFGPGRTPLKWCENVGKMRNLT